MGFSQDVEFLSVDRVFVRNLVWEGVLSVRPGASAYRAEIRVDQRRLVF